MCGGDPLKRLVEKDDYLLTFSVRRAQIERTSCEGSNAFRRGKSDLAEGSAVEKTVQSKDFRKKYRSQGSVVALTVESPELVEILPGSRDSEHIQPRITGQTSY